MTWPEKGERQARRNWIEMEILMPFQKNDIVLHEIPEKSTIKHIIPIKQKATIISEKTDRALKENRSAWNILFFAKGGNKFEIYDGYKNFRY